MKVKFEVLGCGSFEGRSREGQSYRKLRMMGFALDCDGDKVAATCDMGYGASLDSVPQSGEIVVVDISSLDTKNAMVSMTFAKLYHVAPSQGRDLKR